MNKYVDHIEKQAAKFDSAIEGANNVARGVANGARRAANSRAGKKAKEGLSAAKSSPAGKTLGNMVIPGMSVGATGAYVNNKMTQGEDKRKEEKAPVVQRPQPEVVYPALSSMYPEQSSV